MASATLNSTLMASLVSRSVSSVESHSTVAHSTSQEGFGSPSSLSPSSGGRPPSILPDNPFDSSAYSHFLSESDLKENSISGGEVSTEDEEGSSGDGLAYYFKRSSEDSLNQSSKKRRKQNKPVRLPSEENVADKQLSPNVPQEESFTKMQESSLIKNRELFRCPHCQAETSSEEALRSHIIEDHIGRVLSEENFRHSYRGIAFPRDNEPEKNERSFVNQEREEGEMIPLNLSSSGWEERLNSQSRENGERNSDICGSLPASIYSSPYGEGKFSLPSLVPIGPSPFLLPFLQHPSQQGLDRERLHPTQQPIRPVSNGQTQIFNLEAYCDLCNKEFCNKYFLKTHKANKHGIYSPDICSSQVTSSSSTAIVSSISSIHSSQNSSSFVSSQMNVPALQNSPLSSIPLPGSPFAGAFISANMSSLPLRPLIPPPFPSLNKSQMSFTKSDILGSSSKNGIINIEAYCEICQKEFCNKYFLKRHKSKIHNIDIEVTIKNTSRSIHFCKPGYDRPDGWCDACRKDIGSRARLNTHKLNVHGPHIIVPVTSHSQPDQTLSNQEHQAKNISAGVLNENFSPWDSKRGELSSAPSKNEPHCSTSNGNSENIDRLRISSNLMGISVEDQCRKKESNEYWAARNEQQPNIKRPWNESQATEENMLMDMVSISKISCEDNDSVSVKEEPRSLTDDSLEKVSEKIYTTKADQVKEDRIYSSSGYKDSITQERSSEAIGDEKASYKFKESAKEHSQNPPLSKEMSEAPRTPGASSSTDENSRELGLVTREGQPPIAKPMAGTKYTADQLRQLGVINPDAFCELCCKEFCNKYFLRTHRIKKHGIYTPEFSDRSKHFNEPSPFALSRILERQALEMRHGVPEMEGDVQCDLCHRSFPTLYLLHMHKYYIHGPGQEILQQEQMLQFQQYSFQQERIRQQNMFSEEHKMEDIIKTKNDAVMNQSEKDSIADKQHKSEMSNNPHSLLKVNSFHNQEELQQCSNLLQRIPNENKRSKAPEVRPSSHPSANAQSNVQEEELKSDTQEPDTSQGLRKLQSMLLELNRQDEGATKCKICQKDISNKYFLRAHLMTEHGILPPGDITMSTLSEAQTPRASREGSPHSPPSSPIGVDNQGYCNLCKRDFFSRYILQQHLLSAHGIFSSPQNPMSFLDRIRAELENRDDRRPVSNSRSYCEICNKELCNKYFMKTHMLKMHGINIENGSSGGVTCDICRKELCSKYFLRVHKQNTHGLVEECPENENLVEEGELQVCPLCSKRFKNFKWLQTHLNSDHDKLGKQKWKEIENTLPRWDKCVSGYQMCNVCGQNFSDLVALQIHVIKAHGVHLSEREPGESSFMEQGREFKTDYECSLCHMMFPSFTSLHDHEKTHNENENSLPTPSKEFYCPQCTLTIPSLELYHQHILHHQLEGFLKPPIYSEDNSPSKTNLESSGNKSPDTKEDEARTKTPLGQRTLSTPRKRWRCYECGTKFKSRNHCILHVQTQHIPKSRLHFSGRSPYRRKLFRSRKWGGNAAKSLSTLRKLLRKKQPIIPGIPTSHAQPSGTEGQFVMQPFLLNKQGCDGQASTLGDEEQPFVPSLVYLPVSRKVQRPLTVSFCLTPA